MVAYCFVIGEPFRASIIEFLIDHYEKHATAHPSGFSIHCWLMPFKKMQIWTHTLFVRGCCASKRTEKGMQTTTPNRGNSFVRSNLNERLVDL